MEVDPFVATVPERSAEAVVPELEAEPESVVELESLAALEEELSSDELSLLEASELAESELEDPQAANIIAAVVTAARTAITCFFFISYILHQTNKKQYAISLTKFMLRRECKAGYLHFVKIA